jgi:hypothetical protein
MSLDIELDSSATKYTGKIVAFGSSIDPPTQHLSCPAGRPQAGVYVSGGCSGQDLSISCSPVTGQFKRKHVDVRQGEAG